MDDRELLSAYAENHSQDAFRDLVERHIPMVYSVARRVIRDALLAEEVAQLVFTTLARKAASIQPPQVVGGWLYNTARHLSRNALRKEQRRRQREQEAMAMHALEYSNPRPPTADQLEAAMSELKDDDQASLVLRFLENRTLRDVGTELGISERVRASLVRGD